MTHDGCSPTLEGCENLLSSSHHRRGYGSKKWCLSPATRTYPNPNPLVLTRTHGITITQNPAGSAKWRHIIYHRYWSASNSQISGSSSPKPCTARRQRYLHHSAIFRSGRMLSGAALCRDVAEGCDKFEAGTLIRGKSKPFFVQ